MTIQVLDPLVAQKIAAGEVVDRPGSVVKELVENALDAGASRIEVALSEGGASKIMVRDDGGGMDGEDAARSVLAHATSKITEASDVESVGTLGFRGEALPSIASVSLLELTTSTSDDTPGTKVVVDGGAEGVVSSASRSKGTTVMVSMLFYNVPARRAFLKGKRVERAHITEIVTHLAIVHPGVAFQLTESDKSILSLAPAQSLRERLSQVYGVGKARSMRQVSMHSGPFKVTGLAALPSLTFTNRASVQSVSVNGRWVRAESLMRGLDDGYRGTVPAGRYPPVALAVEVDPAQVDVNVHPTKQTVRFSDEKAARQAVADAVKLALNYSGGGAPSESAAPSKPTAADGEREPQPSAQLAQQETPGLPTGSSTPPKNTGGSGNGGPSPDRHRQAASREDLQNAGKLEEFQRRIQDASQPRSDGAGDAASGEALVPAAGDNHVDSPTQDIPARGTLPTLAELRVVGQVGSGYILLEEGGAVWVVDQHAAHERAILDRLADSEEPPTVQTLLTPEVVELSAEDVALAEESLEELSVYGFEAEPFGPRSVRIHAVISTLASHDVGGAFQQALSTIRGTEAGMSREERMLATIACHSAVKLGNRLAKEEMEELIKQWLSSRLPATCPHGRSICYRIPLTEMATRLDRRLG